MSQSKEEYLVHGYIRSIQKLLSQDIIIPIDIISLCLLFWNKSSTFIVIKKDETLNILHSNSKHYCKIKCDKHTFFSFSPSPPLCYIPNIYPSAKSTKQCDAILCNNIFYLFPSNSINDDEIACNEISNINTMAIERGRYSYKATKDLTRYLYCGNKHGIIHEHNGGLYQLKIAQTITKDASFNRLNIDPDDNIWNNMNCTTHGSTYLSMSYLQNSERIFAIHNRQYSKKFGALLTRYETTFKKEIPEVFAKLSQRCGVFDLNEKRWIETAEIQYQRLHIKKNKFYHIESCINEWNDNIIYAVSSTGNTQRYDFKKDEWYALVNDGTSVIRYKRHIVWMDNMNIICCVGGDGKYFGSIDVRENKPKWKSMEGLSGNEDITSISIV